MAIELNYKQEAVDTTNDSIVIRKYIHGIEGGKALPTAAIEAWKEFSGSPIVPAGIPVYMSKSNKSLKLADVAYSGSGFSDRTDKEQFILFGVVASTFNVDKEGAAIMTHGVVNFNAINIVDKQDRSGGLWFNPSEWGVSDYAEIKNSFEW